MNNAEWCDAVCRALGVPGNFTPDIWLQPKAGPPIRMTGGPLDLAVQLCERNSGRIKF